ncbi:MAG TPA: hypothetical protein VHG93_01585 [Longimicrobium sp.]|nr:hypothetical protein [Longimicrobium sp.]
MPERSSYPLRVVDGLDLSQEHRELLRPGELLRGRDGRRRRLPRWFFEVPSWEAALQTDLSPHFKVWEFLNVDVREHELQRLHWPRYLPLAVGLLAAALETFRAQVDTYVHIAANGGYRSPRHRLTEFASPHCWGTAANIYRVGDDWLDDERTIGRYSRLARSLTPAFWARPFGQGLGETDDHLHLDVGFAVVAPHGGGDEPDPGDPEPLHGPGEDEVTKTAEG